MQQSDAGKGSEPNLVQPQTYAPGTGRKYRRSPIQQAADLTIKAMLLQGTSIRKIAAALHVSPGTVQTIKRRIQTQAPDAEDLKSGLMSPQRDANAGKLIDHFIGKGLKMKKIKGSDALGAVKMYAERRWPAQQAAPPGPRVSFVHVNIDVARLDTGAHPTTICSTEHEGIFTKDEKPL